MVNQATLKSIMHYSPDTGEFRRHCGALAGGMSKHPKGKVYWKIEILGDRYLAHRLAWLYVYGEFPRHQIDHIDGNGLNNKISNLRDVTPMENSRNQRRRKDNTSGCTGVRYYEAKKKFTAQIREGGKQKHLGYFQDIEDAIAARKLAEKRLGYHSNHGTKRAL